jgi:hypothetical protein
MPALHIGRTAEGKEEPSVMHEDDVRCRLRGALTSGEWDAVARRVALTLVHESGIRS